MNFGAATLKPARRSTVNFVIAVLVACVMALAFASQGFAQESARIAPAPTGVAVDQTVATPPAAEVDMAATTGDEVLDADVAAGADAAGYTPLGPEMIKGQPESGAYGFQKQYTDDGEYALWMHNAILLPVIFAISILVLVLLLWVVAKYRKKANPVPSRTTHNTVIEVVWTLVPALVLVAIAVPSITLLARQYETAPEDAITIKATGYQWYWGYTYADNGGFEIISNMMDEDEAKARGLPGQLAVDNRMVVPANTPLRIQTTGADVIHAFGIPSLWFKIDAVPGRLNERMMTINEPGIYYGQCMELCGPRHAYMPISIEALPRDQWEAWVRLQGGTVAGDAEVAVPAISPAGTPAVEETITETAAQPAPAV